MLNNDYLKKILEALVAQGSVDGKTYYDTNVKTTTSSITLENKNPYLVLFEEMPNLEGQGGKEISLNGYEPLPLTNPSIQGAYFFTNVPQENGNEISITNTSPIQMHSIDENENRTQEILGFGIVDYNKNNKPLIAWGRLQDDHEHLVKGEAEVLDPREATAPKLTGGSVPIFDPGTLTLAFNSSEGGLDEYLQKDLLKMIVNYKPNNSDFINEITFNSYYPKVALFTNLENKTELNIAGYTRKNLYGITPTVAQDNINGLQFKDSAFIKGTTGTIDHPGDAYAKIQNTNEIQMSAITDDEIGPNGIKVYGFGIYAQSVLDNSNSDRLVAWGPLVDEHGEAVKDEDNNVPTLFKGSVPIFYKDKFEMLLGGENTETYITLDKMELDLYKLLRGSGEEEAEAPEGWSNDYLNYYTKENLKFSPNKDSKWAPGAYYEKVNVPSYELIETKPADFDTTQYLYYKELEENNFVPATAEDEWASGTYYNKTSNNTEEIIALDPDDLYYLGVEFKPNTYTGQPTFISSNPATFSVDNSTGAINYQQVNNGQKGTFTAILNQKETEIGTLKYKYRKPTGDDIQLSMTTSKGTTSLSWTIKISFKENTINDFTQDEQNSLKFKSVNVVPNSTPYGNLEITNKSDKEIEVKINKTSIPAGQEVGQLNLTYGSTSATAYSLYYRLIAS